PGYSYTVPNFFWTWHSVLGVPGRGALPPADTHGLGAPVGAQILSGRAEKERVPARPHLPPPRPPLGGHIRWWRCQRTSQGRGPRPPCWCACVSLSALPFCSHLHLCLNLRLPTSRAIWYMPLVHAPQQGHRLA